jgi:hypothetical protein
MNLLHVPSGVLRGRSAVALLHSVILLPLAVSCGGDSAGGDGAAVRDSAGVRIVENREAAWTEAAAWHLSSAPLVQIGAVSSDNPAYEFSSIQGITRLSDGRIVVLEGQNSEVRYFDSAGKHRVTRGGRGGGPGEFGFAGSMVRWHADTVVVEDRLMRQVFFRRMGSTLAKNRSIGVSSWGACQLSNAITPHFQISRC